MTTVIIVIWIAIVTVMYGGFALLQFLTRSQRPLSDWQLGMFRVGHAHAGVLQLMALLYATFIRETDYSETTQVVWTVVLLVGVLLQSGGFFLHMRFGRPDQPSIGTRTTMTGAFVLATAIAVLVYGLSTA